MAEREDDYVPLLVDGEERSAQVQWFVVPVEGWLCWRGEVELTWPNGDRKTLWRGHSWNRSRLIRRTQRRLARWAIGTNNASRSTDVEGAQ